MFNLTFKEAFTDNLQNSFPVLKALQQKAKHEGLRGKKETDVEILVLKKLKENIKRRETAFTHSFLSSMVSGPAHFEIVEKVFHL